MEAGEGRNLRLSCRVFTANLSNGLQQINKTFSLKTFQVLGLWISALDFGLRPLAFGFLMEGVGRWTLDLDLAEAQRLPSRFAHSPD